MSHPIGTEKEVAYNGRQYIKIKVASNPSKWVFKHIYVYEQVFGALKKSDVLIFLDNNALNCELENLIVIDRRILLIMTKQKLPRRNREETLASIGVAKLLAKICDTQNRLEEEKKWEDEMIISEKRDYKSRYREIGLKVMYYRKLRGYTKLQLSEKTGIKLEYLKNLENPSKYIEPSLESLFRISDTLNIKVEKLLENSIQKEG